MNEKALRTLEYFKITDMLKERCVSDGGRERAAELRPTAEYSHVMSLLEQTADAESILFARGSSPVNSFDDINAPVRRSMLGSVLSMGELLRCARFMNSCRRVKAALTPEGEGNSVQVMAEALIAMRTDEEEIFRCIISEDEMSDSASSELASIRRQIRRAGEKIKEKLNSYLHNPELSKLLQDQIISVRGDRYVLPVRSEHKGSVPGIVHDQSASGQTLFIEPMAVVEINNELRLLAGREREETERILTALSGRIKENGEALLQNAHVMCELDFIFARGKLSCDMKAVTPKVNTNGYINIKAGRHPLIPAKSVVPLDVWLGRDFTILLVTGPNTGGKTVTLKTIGLFQLMIQSGLNIPCNTGTEMTIFDSVFADIGDEQSIEQSLSTFSAHMSNIASVMRDVTDKSLVLFDELGAGTDPNEGASLAMAILEELRIVGARTVATTHYSELKAYSLTTEGIENASVEFNNQTLKPTYKLSVGVPGMSNAFYISERLGLSRRLIERARELMSGERVRFESVLEKAEEQRRRASEENERAAALRAETERMNRETAALKAELAAKKEEMLEKARKEAKKIIEEADVQVKQYIDEIKAMKEGANDEALIKMQTKRKAMLASQRVTAPQEQHETADPHALTVGKTVYVIPLAKNAVIKSVPSAKGEVLVQAGAFQMNVKVTDIAEPQHEKKSAQRTVIDKSSKVVPMSIDVRGKTVDEAMLEIDRYIEEAAYSGYGEVTVIHGKGTGALRAGIMRELKSHRTVKSLRMGKYGEGDAGVTVVELKK